MAVKHVMRTMPSHGVESFTKWNEPEKKLNEELQKCKANVHKALCGEYILPKKIRFKALYAL